MVIKVWRNPLLKIFWLASLLYLMTKQIEDLRMLFMLGKEENQIFTSPINKTVQVLREENVFFAYRHMKIVFLRTYQPPWECQNLFYKRFGLLGFMAYQPL